MTFLVGASVIVILGLLRLAVHRRLAPERVAERRTPADLGLPFREVRIPTENSKSLFGWFVAAASAARAPAVAVLHGWGGNAEMMMPLLRPLHDAGLAVLLFDARCHGRSDEDSFASLPRFAEDFEGAIRWLRQQDEVDPDRIALIGHSVGAGAALLVGSRRPDLSAIVSLAAFSHPVAMMRRWLECQYIPYRPVGWMLLRYVQWIIGHRFDEIAPMKTVERIRCPVLLVHGSEDATVPVAEAHAIHARRSGDHVRLKIITGSHDDGDLATGIHELVEFIAAHCSQPTVSDAGVRPPAVHP